jgi:tRNA1(Val) A37 N6-methylase TrmN6
VRASLQQAQEGDMSSRQQVVQVVDFGAGSGHVGLLVAWLRRETCAVTLLERSYEAEEDHFFTRRRQRQLLPSLS